MPEYLAPGVFVEEVSYRSKSIEGVPTSTTGFVGLTHYGPVRYDGGPRNCEPRLVTSYVEFERVYGGLTPLQIGGNRVPYLAHAARAFFLNGGRRLYVSRTYTANAGSTGVASRDVLAPQPAAAGNPARDGARFGARWPGKDGNVTVETVAVRGGNIAKPRPAGSLGETPTTIDHLISDAASHGIVVEIVQGTGATPNRVAPTVPSPDRLPVAANLRLVWISRDRKTVQLLDESGQLDATSYPADTLLLPMTLTIIVHGENGRLDTYPRLNIAPPASGSIDRVLGWNSAADDDAIIAFEFTSLNAQGAAVGRSPAVPPDPPPVAGAPQPAPDIGRWITVFQALCGTPATPVSTTLIGGDDGAMPGPDDLNGKDADPDDITKKATGLKALAEVDDIAIVAMPDAADMDEEDKVFVATQYLIRHAEDCRYRIAVVDGPKNASLNRIRSFRGNFDSKYAALYHPWIEILDPNGPPAPGVPTPHLFLPPSGFVAGIYARNDITRGVYKAPANEVVYGLTRFEMNINQGRNEVLNPEHINALRFFPGRGNRVWGARTLSSDPEWLYVNVRRLFIYLEHSIDKATQWAVFEPNGEALWRNITRTVSDFLEVQWRNGALMGSTPDEAFFVLCDRSTMTQNDLDNGRLICLIGVAPVKPAEFVIFRIGQWTAAAKG
jgi:phage tail sheath protein FI